MSHRIEKLKAIVQELETELASLDTSDAEAREVLQDAIHDLHAALGQADQTAIDSADSLIERFRSAEESFQVTHPTLSGLVLRMINALGQLGI